MKKKIGYFTNIAPHYREKLWLKLVKSTEFDFHFFYGDSTKGGIKQIDFNTDEWLLKKEFIHKVNNIRLKGRLIFQMGVLRNILVGKWDIVVFLGDVNLISNWLGAFFARLLGIKVIFWGHGLYGDEKGINKYIRLLFLSIPNLNLVYGEWAKEQMKKNGLKDKNIKVIYNSLDYEKSIKLRVKAIDKNFFIQNIISLKQELPTLLFIGRLTPQKRIELLFDAVANLRSLGKYYNLIIVGDGSEMNKLEIMAKKLKIEVYFYGACYDEETNAKLIANSDLCVSPGNVGLTAIHSLSYGTPVCTNDNFKEQMPEFEAITEGFSGCYFDWEKKNLAATIQNWFDKKLDRETVRQNCYQIIDEKYNPQNQLEIVENAILSFYKPIL